MALRSKNMNTRPQSPLNIEREVRRTIGTCWETLDAVKPRTPGRRAQEAGETEIYKQFEGLFDQ